MQKPQGQVTRDGSDWWVYVVAGILLYVVFSIAPYLSGKYGGAFGTAILIVDNLPPYSRYFGIPFVIYGVLRYLSEPLARKRKAPVLASSPAASEASTELSYSEPPLTTGFLSSADAPVPNNACPKSDKNTTLAEELIHQGKDAYVALPYLLSPWETRAYQEMTAYYGERVHVFSKVRVVDVITPNAQRYPKKSREFLSLFRQLSQWHLDFVLVEPHSFRVICAVELDDNSHQRPDRVRRDKLLNKAFVIAGVKLFRVSIRDGRLETLPDLAEEMP